MWKKIKRLFGRNDISCNIDQAKYKVGEEVWFATNICNNVSIGYIESVRCTSKCTGWQETVQTFVYEVSFIFCDRHEVCYRDEEKLFASKVDVTVALINDLINSHVKYFNKEDKEEFLAKLKGCINN